MSYIDVHWECICIQIITTAGMKKMVNRQAFHKVGFIVMVIHKPGTE